MATSSVVYPNYGCDLRGQTFYARLSMYNLATLHPTYNTVVWNEPLGLLSLLVKEPHTDRKNKNLA